MNGIKNSLTVIHPSKKPNIMSVSRKQFDLWAEEAIEMVPKRLAKGMRDLVFVVDDRPTRKIIKESGFNYS